MIPDLRSESRPKVVLPFWQFGPLSGEAAGTAPNGILAINGPNIKKDERVYGASLLGIASTVLTALGCPLAEDMDGKAPAKTFAGAPRSR